MFQGWASLGGTEIWNAARTEAYTAELAPGFSLTDCTDCDNLALALGEEYRLPVLDEPSWFDPDNPDTYNFAGFYPLSITGVEDSNRQVEVLESIRNGGVVGPIRLTTKQILVRGILIAGDPCSLQAGIEWFKNVLSGNPCIDNCEGDNFCFFYCCPDVAEGVVDPSSLAVPHELSLAQYNWEVDSGRWRDGIWNPTDSPAIARGPLFEPPCDDTVMEVTFSIVEDQSIILNAVSDSGQAISTTGEVVLRRTNFARNPSFQTGNQSWQPITGSTITKDTGMESGTWESGTDLPNDSQILVFQGGNQVSSGEIFSARVTAELLPGGDNQTNLVENPRAEDSDYFWFLASSPASYSASLDNSNTFVGPTSYRVEATQSNAIGGLGFVLIGSDGTEFMMESEENTNYYTTVQAYPTVSTTVSMQISYLDEDDNLISNPDVDIPVTANQWNQLEFSTVSPPNTAKSVISLFTLQAGVDVEVGDSISYDAAMMVQSSTPVDYFDGFSNNAVWNGTQNQSTSTLSLVPEDVCLSLELGISVGGSITPIPGNEYNLNIGEPVDLEITGVQTPAIGQLVGIVRTCNAVSAGTRVRLSHAIITKTNDQVEYFDGSSSIDGYDTYWTGATGNSFSRMEIQDDKLSLMIFNGSGPYRPEIIALESTTVHVDEIVVWARETIEPHECADRNYTRILRDVVVTSGPEILRKVEECDHSIAEVEFTITAANPYTWHVLPFEFDLVEDAEPLPLPPGALIPAIWPPITHYPPSLVSAEDDCPEDVSQFPISDPNCPLPPTPPRPPLPEDCLEDVVVYFRRAIGINGELFSQWQEAVPIVELQVQSSVAVRQARVRFYPNPLQRDSLQDIDLCGYCGEFIISYMPGNSSFIIDGMTERARVELPGDITREATHLLYGSDGGPMKWPTLTCGTPYIMTVDVAPVNAELVAADMTIAVRS